MPSARTYVRTRGGRTFEPALAGPGEQRFAARERLARGRGDLDGDDLAGCGESVEVDNLVMGGAAAQARGVVAGGALDEDVQGAADEALGALAGAARGGGGEAAPAGPR